MKHAIVESGVVANIVIADSEFGASQGWVPADAEVSIGWLYDGQAFTPAPPVVKTPEEVQADIVAATQARLDAFARTRSYDDIKSASTYAGCSVPKFNTEGSYCQDRRAETWAKLYEMLDEVNAGTRPMPSSFADVEPELPALAWPT
jgi:hypothetical protein